MLFATLLHRLCRRPRTAGQAPRKRPRSFVPRLELLEDRALPSAVGFSPPVTYALPLSSAGSSGRTGSVAVDDFNRDGKPDLAVVNAGGSIPGSGVDVLLGNGDGTLRPAVNYAVGTNPSSVAVGDFNGDDKLDLAVVNTGSNTVSVLLGNGDGTFQAARAFAAAYSPLSAVVGDFNGDGKADLAVLTQSQSGASRFVTALLGNGDGTFQGGQSFGVRGAPSQLVAGDFNGDGKLDLATDNGDVLRGNGDGTFQAAPTIPAVYGGSVAVGDFNGDGKSDLATTFNSQLNVLLGNGDLTFRNAGSYSLSSSLAFFDPRSVAVADFNGDGKPDLVTANDNDFVSDNGADISVLVGNGDGTFQAAENFDNDGTGAFATSVAVADFNGDGRPDVVTSSAYYVTASVRLNQLATATAVSGPASSTYGQGVTYTATVTSNGSPVAGGTVTFLNGTTPLSGPLPVDGNGQASFRIATLDAGSYTLTASYSGTPGGAGITPVGPSTVSTGLTVNPVPLSATAVNFGATAGAPFSGAVATFANADPFGGAASYTAVIDWGDGSTSAGTITGSGTLTVSGAHTYADPGSYAATVQIGHVLGDTTTATAYPTATVVGLSESVQGGLTGGIGFWNNKNGQRLIDSFNGGPDSTALSTWLATAFPNLYGGLLGYTNAQVASFYQGQFALPGLNAEAEVLATALNVYATTLSLGGTAGQAYGFTASADGLGAYSFDVGADGAAVGVANGTRRNVYELLEAVDAQAAYGVLYNGDATLRKEADDLFSALNQAGAVS